MLFIVLKLISRIKKYGNRYKNLDKVSWENSDPVTDTDHATNIPDTF
ncbi:MAG: hypothetical protein ACLU5J_12885 [Christensenellales bacterium]